MKNWIKEGCAVTLMAFSLSAGAQSLADMKQLSEGAKQGALKAAKVSGIQVSRACKPRPMKVFAPGMRGVKGARTVVKRETTGAAVPETYYNASAGYYNLVPGYMLRYSADNSATLYAENGILGYNDRDLEFVNRTPEADSFEWNFYGQTYTDDTIKVHPMLSEAGYMGTPKLTASLAGADSTYQMGAYTNAEGKAVDGMVALTGAGYVYNVDVDALSFQDTGFQSLSGDWTSMIFGSEQDAKMAYMEMYDAPKGGPVALNGTAFYVATPTTTDLSEKTFKVSWVAKQKATGKWEEVANFDGKAEYVPSMSGDGLRLWWVTAGFQPELTLVEDSFYVMIEGPQDKSSWTMLFYSRYSTEVDKDYVPVGPIDPIKERNTAYYVYTEGERAGQIGQYSGTVESPEGEVAGYVTMNASLDIYQHIMVPYIVVADDDANMMMNETGEIDLGIDGETKKYLLLDWYGTPGDGATITASISESTDGDWLAVSGPVAAAGLNRSAYFSMSVTASAKDFLTEGRRATLTLTDNYGFSRKVVVYQGDHEAADKALGIAEANASGTVSAVYADGAFELAYPADYKTVNVYGVSGRLVGNYILEADGSDRIPAAGLQEGVYLLQFTGKDSRTVKVRK